LSEKIEYCLTRVPVFGGRADSSGVQDYRIILMPKGVDGPKLYKLRRAQQTESEELEVVARGAT
jgi:hypothetical protein